MSNEKIDVKPVVAARMRAAREGAGLSQGQAAKRMDMHRPTISEIEAGRRKVSSEELRQFAELYGVETWWLSCAEPEEHHSVATARYEMAARQLSKLKQKDFDTLMVMLSSMRKMGGNDDVED